MKNTKIVIILASALAIGMVIGYIGFYRFILCLFALIILLGQYTFRMIPRILMLKGSRGLKKKPVITTVNNTADTQTDSPAFIPAQPQPVNAERNDIRDLVEEELVFDELFR